MPARPGCGQRRADSRPAQAHGLEMLGAGDMGDAPAAEASQVLDGEHRAALVIGHQAERVRIVGLGKHVDHRQAVARAARSAGACRPAARVTTRPSMRLPRSWSRCWRSRAGSSVALHMKTATPSSARRSSSASTIGSVKRPKLSLEMMPIGARARRGAGSGPARSADSRSPGRPAAPCRASPAAAGRRH